MRRIAFAVAATTVLLGGGCFEIEPPEPDAGPTGSTLVGRVIVTGSSAQSARAAIATGVRRSRSAMRRVRDGTPVDPADLGPPETPSISPEGRGLSSRRPLGQTKKLEWWPSDVLVAFERHTYTDKAAVQDKVDALLARAGDAVRDVRASVHLCSGWMVCKVELTGREGKDLDLEETARVAHALAEANEGEFVAVSRNFIKRAFRVPNDEYYPLQWHFDFARLPTAWDITTGSDDIVVAVVDTGLRFQHPDIIGRTVPGFDLISEPSISGDEDGRDPDAEDPGDQALPNNQSSWHGTHVGGTVAANTDNTTGVAGVMWQGKLQPVRVLGLGTQGTDFDILSGVLWAVGSNEVENAAVNATPAKVVNLSLGGPTDPNGQQTWQTVLDTITNSQKDDYGRPIFITAAGNSNETADNITPANIPGVITVGASRFDGRRAAYSNWGATLDVLAPGGQTNIDQNNDGWEDGIYSLYSQAYAFEQGTSMAAPHVAGIVGLLASVQTDVDQATALQLLRQTANPAGVCNEGCGAGHVDAAALLVGAGGSVAEAPLIAADATRLIFQPEVTSLPVNVYNLGSAPLDFTTEIVGPQAQLYSITPTSGSVLPGGVLPAAVTLTRGEFGAGYANLQFIGAGTATEQLVRVDLAFDDTVVPAFSDLFNAQVGLLKVSEDGSQLVGYGEPVVARSDDDFAFRFEGLEAGLYYVYAVGDDNNDGEYDQNRESLGMWKVVSAPEPLEVDGVTTYTGVEFGLEGGFRLEGVGAVGQPCGNNLDCTFTGDAECITDWPGGYCSRTCDDGFCGAGASCEELDCGGPCNVCLSTCVSDTQCRGDEAYICDPFGTCTPEGF